ncbi:MAG TPA: glycosyltransferase family 4 protein [Thermoleophilaceae bacterium]|nr:glycosyltransferase family 4 protein [Thermoleophilaceae bacterium]
MSLRVLAVAQAAAGGGAELVLLRLAPALADQDVDLRLAVPAEGGLARAARNADIPVDVLPIGPLRRGGWPRAVLAWPRARRLVGRERPDVVWLNGVVPQRLVPALGDSPCLLHLHDLVEHRPLIWRSARFWRTVRLAACDSDAVARAAAAHGAPAERLRTVRVPIDTPDAAARPEWADGRPVVGFVGRIEPRKGVLDLLVAAAALAERVPDVRVVIVRGPDVDPDRDYESRVRAAADALGDRVVTIGPVEGAARLMPWFDVLCVPSLREPFGTVAAEALAAGTPAVVTDSGGMPEYVTAGRSGEVVPPGDPEALAAALERVLARADEMADAARADAARFATPGVAREMAALLREVAAA